MWEEILTRLERLARLDNQRQVFGAEHHYYALAFEVPEEYIAAVEHRLGVELPSELREFYLNFGNGTVGPYYGLRPIDELEGFRAGEPYGDAASLRALALKEGRAEDSDGYFTVERSDLAGLIAIIDEGCGHQVCLITNGSRVGEVVNVSIDGYVHETGRTLIQTYEAWVDRELGKFEMVERLMSSGASLDEINSEVREKFETYDAEDIIVSIANVEKPPELFGSGGSKIYHGATQTPWYEKVLREWRETNADG
jgi:hypothetical protein